GSAPRGGCAVDRPTRPDRYTPPGPPHSAGRSRGSAHRPVGHAHAPTGIASPRAQPRPGPRAWRPKEPSPRRAASAALEEMRELTGRGGRARAGEVAAWPPDAIPRDRRLAPPRAADGARHRCALASTIEHRPHRPRHHPRALARGAPGWASVVAAMPTTGA